MCTIIKLITASGFINPRCACAARVVHGGRACVGVGVYSTRVLELYLLRVLFPIVCVLFDGARSVVSVIWVYLPCIDQGIDCYTNHLNELENIINESLLL